MAAMGTYNALIGEHAFYSASNTSEALPPPAAYTPETSLHAERTPLSGEIMHRAMYAGSQIAPSPPLLATQFKLLF